MHATSMDAMETFVRKYLGPPSGQSMVIFGTHEPIRILDVGSYDVNGSYKDLFDLAGFKYLGMDLEAGPNVDLVAKGLYNWELDQNKFDVVISGQCLEHVEDTHQWIRQVDAYLRIGGIVCIIAPWKYGEHRYPVDCWRIFPDGIKFLAKMVGWTEVEVYKTATDTVGIFRKTPAGELPFSH